MRSYCLLLLILVLGKEASADEFAWTPDLVDITKVEQTLELPNCSYKLKDYVRFYWGTIEDGTPILNAQFHTPFGSYTDSNIKIESPEKAGAVFINDMKGPPMILDGGCSVITLKWNMALNELIGIRCNGIA